MGRVVWGKKAKEMKENLSKVASTRTGEKNPFYGREHSEETKKKIALANKGKKPTNQRPVVIGGVEYPSATEASRQLNVVPATILHRIKSKNPKYDRYFYK